MRRTVIVTALTGALVMAPSALAATEKVKAVDFDFRPAALKIDRGDKVKWTSKEGRHDVSFKSGINFRERIDRGETTSSLKFKDDGSFKYICRIHRAEDMKGKVKVG
jgi:plastocyanin